MANPNRLPISSRTRFLVFKLDKFRCRICGDSADDGARLEVDHKIPVSKGGTNDLSNLWTLCYDCNRGKTNYLINTKRLKDNFFRSNELFLLPAPKAPIALLPAPNKLIFRMNKIKKLRVDKGLTLNELATQANIGIASLARLEAGGKAYASTLGKIARALGVDSSELMEFEAVSAKKDDRLMGIDLQPAN